MAAGVLSRPRPGRAVVCVLVLFDVVQVIGLGVPAGRKVGRQGKANKSRYGLGVRPAGVPLQGERHHWHLFRHFLRNAHPAYTPEEIDRYIEAWSEPGAATGMINYYRSSVRNSPKSAEAALRPIKAPTLVIWGQRDRYLGEELAEPDRDDVPNLDRVERLPDASHWVHHDEAERVTQLLTDFSLPPSQPGADQGLDGRRAPGLSRDCRAAGHGQRRTHPAPASPASADLGEHGNRPQVPARQAGTAIPGRARPQHQPASGQAQ
jgi:hypothetical protein